MKTRQDPYRRWNIPVGLAAFLIFGCVYAVFAGYSLVVPQPGAPGLRQICIGGVAIGVIAGYMQYLDFFFRYVRPAMAGWIGRLFGVKVKEKVQLLGGSGWDTEGGSVVTTLLVYLLDGVILVTAVIGPIAVIGIPAFILGELVSGG